MAIYKWYIYKWYILPIGFYISPTTYKGNQETPLTSWYSLGLSGFARYEVELGKKNPKVFQLRWCFGCFGDVEMFLKQQLFGEYMGVSKNRGTPKWMVKIMENPIKMDDLGGKPTIFGNIPLDCTIYIQLLYYSDQYCNHIDVQDWFSKFCKCVRFLNMYCYM